MARSGKGVLRIAIEDFLETFDYGNLFEFVLGKAGHLMLDKIFTRYITILDDVANVSGMPIMKALASTHSTEMNVFEKGFVLVLMLLSIAASFGQAATQPFGQLVTYGAHHQAKDARLSINNLVELMRRFPELAAQFKQDDFDLGWTDERTNAMYMLASREIDVMATIALLWRGEITFIEYQDKITKLGFRPEAANELLKAMSIIPNVGDLIRMSVREAFSPDVVSKFQYDEAFPKDVLEFTKKQGLPDEWVRRYWYAHWELPSPQMGYEMLHRLRAKRSSVPFTDADLDLLLRTADYAPYFRERMKAISYQPVTRVDIRRIYKLKIFDAVEVKERYMDIGYNEKDAQILADFTVKYEDEQGNDKRDKYKALSFTILRNLYQKGKLSKSEVEAKLLKDEYDPDEIKLIFDYFDLAAVDNVAVDYKIQFVKDMTNDIIDAYAARMITKDNCSTALNALGLNGTEIDYRIQNADYHADLNDLNLRLKYIREARLTGAKTRDETIALLGQLGITGAQQSKVIDDMELALTYRNKRLTEAQYRVAAQRNLITIDQYKQNLIGMEYTDADIDLLVKLYLTPGA